MDNKNSLALDLLLVSIVFASVIVKDIQLVEKVFSDLLAIKTNDSVI